MIDASDVRVTLVRPGGVATKTFADGAAAMRVCLGYIHDPDDGILAEMKAKHEPVPWASAAVREEASQAVSVRTDLKDDLRGQLLAWIAATPYFEGS
jgi:hypothetical protein